MYTIPPQMFSNLLCVNCKKYLSVGPIRTLDDGTSICGRCKVTQTSHESPGFDVMFKDKQFPCCYDKNGCLEILTWGFVHRHEQICRYQKVKYTLTTVSLSTLRQLVCAMCKQYLNVPPIHVRSDRSYVCGRCPDLEWQWPTPTSTRDHSFEDVLKRVTYPCQNFMQGCKIPLKWGEVKAHEEGCVHRPYACLIYPDQRCSWIGHTSKIKKHFQTVHPEMVLATKEFLLDITRELRVNLLVTLEQHELFLLLVYVQHSSKTLSTCLRYIGDSRKASQFCYSIKINSVTFDSLPVFPDLVCDMDVTNSMPIPLELASKFLENASETFVDCCLKISRNDKKVRGEAIADPLTICLKSNCYHVGIGSCIQEHQINCSQKWKKSFE